jgi:hypothetical protein
MALPPVYSPGPVFVKIEYSSAYAPHVAILPIRNPWVDTGVGLGSVNRWSDDTPVELSTMMTGYLDKVKVIYPASVTFNALTVYTQATPDVAAVPRAAISTAIAGTSTSTSWSKATQVTLTFRDTEFGLSKLTFLDVPTGNDFGVKTPFTIDPDVSDIVTYYTATTRAFASRKGHRPATLIRQTATLNEKLRRSYRDT